MKIIVALYILFVGSYCTPIPNVQLDEGWSLFKRVYKKQYISTEEETAR